MTLQAQREKDSGSRESYGVPYIVWNDDEDLPLSRGVALEKAIDEANNYENVDEASTYQFERLNNHAYRVTVIYSQRNLSTPEAPTPPPIGEISLEYQFNYQAKPKLLYHAERCIGIYDANGEVTAAEWNVMKTLVNVKIVDGTLSHLGRVVEPLPEVHTIHLILPNANISQALADTIVSLLGHFNETTFMGKPAGQIQFVRLSGAKRTDQDWRLELGFGDEEALFNFDVGGGITIPEIRANSIISSLDSVQTPPADKPIARLAPYLAFLQQVWPDGELNDIGIPEITW